MKPTYFSHLIKGELNVVLSRDAMAATDAASDLVKVFTDAGLRVYTVNTVYNLRVLNAMVRRRLGPEFPIDDDRNGKFYFGSSRMGELGRRGDLLCNVGSDRYDVVIITTWELAASDYRYRQALLHDLLKLSYQGISVIVFSTATTEPQVGRPDRGGIGRLAIVASNIVSAETSYHSNIGLTMEEIREAARQAWPKEYEEYARECERQKRVWEAVRADRRMDGLADSDRLVEQQATRHERDSSPQDLRPPQNDCEIGILTNDHRLTTNDYECAQLSAMEINELGTLQTKKQRRGEALPRPMEKELEYATIN